MLEKSCLNVLKKIEAYLTCTLIQNLVTVLMMIDVVHVVVVAEVSMTEAVIEIENLTEMEDLEKIQKVVDEMILRRREALFHMTESFIRFTSAVAVMEDLLIERLVQNGSIFDQNKSSDFANWIKDGNGVYVQHILIRHDAGDDKAANRALAESTAEALRDGDLTLSDVIGGNAALGISPINEDTENTTPYYLVRGVYEEALETAAFSIGKSGVSSVAETDEGCYIFVRVEDPDYLLLNLQLSSILSSYQWAYAESLIAPYREKLTIEWNEYGSSLDWLAIT